MIPSISSLGQFAPTGVVLFGYGLALIEWSRTPTSPLHPAGQPALKWTIAAVTLTAFMAGCQGLAFGPAAAWGFLTGAGLLLTVQAAGLTPVIRMGGHWADRLGARPFALSSGCWQEWPWGWLAAAWAIMAAWTGLLAWIAPSSIPDGLTLRSGPSQMPPLLQWAFVISLLTLAPIVEEVLFRHYLLYRLARLFKGPRSGLLASIMITSLLWALCHWSAGQPLRFKLAQTLVLGCVLGVTALRKGLDTAIALHWVYNLSLIPAVYLLNGIQGAA